MAAGIMTVEQWTVVGSVAAVIAAATGVILVGYTAWEWWHRIGLAVSAWPSGGSVTVAIANHGRQGTRLKRGWVGGEKFGTAPSYSIDLQNRQLAAGDTPLYFQLDRGNVLAALDGRRPTAIVVEDHAGHSARFVIDDELWDFMR
jgi:hypothetical protein